MQGWKAVMSHANKHFTFGTSLLPVSKWHLGNFFVKKRVNWLALTVIFLFMLREKGN